jgi:hypothetical protein
LKMHGYDHRPRKMDLDSDEPDHRDIVD